MLFSLLNHRIIQQPLSESLEFLLFSTFVGLECWSWTLESVSCRFSLSSLLSLSMSDSFFASSSWFPLVSLGSLSMTSGFSTLSLLDPAKKKNECFYNSWYSWNRDFCLIELLICVIPIYKSQHQLVQNLNI